MNYQLKALFNRSDAAINLCSADFFRNKSQSGMNTVFSALFFSAIRKALINLVHLMAGTTAVQKTSLPGSLLILIIPHQGDRISCRKKRRQFVFGWQYE
jgi:hypothetical protein